MNIAGSATTRTSSRLVEQLRSLAGAGGAGRVGFRAQADLPKRHVGVVASLRAPDDALMRRVAEAGADAIEVLVAGASSVRDLGQRARALSVPVGIVTQREVGEDMATIAAEAGIDWLRIDLTAPVASLGWERPARFISVPIDVDLRVTVALNAPFAEAIVAEPPRGSTWSYDVAEALRLRTLGEIVKKPILAALPAHAPMLSAGTCTALGIDAVLLSVEGAADTDLLTEYLSQLQTPAREQSS